MARHISSEKARANWREVLDAVDGGEEIVIERYGRPVAVLAPYRAETAMGQIKEQGPVYKLDVAQLKAEIVAEVLAELTAIERPSLSWHEGLKALQDSIAAHGGLGFDDDPEAIVEHVRRSRAQLFELEYAHLYR